MTTTPPVTVERDTVSGLSLRDFEYAVALADLGSFGRAAERCGVSQPSLSVQIRRMEARLGTVLFERTTRKVVVTEAGQRLLPQMRKLLGEARVLLDMTVQPGESFGGTLRLSAISTLGPYYFPRALADIQRNHPGTRLELGEGKTDELLRALGRAEIDAALLSAPVVDTTLTRAAIFEEPFCLACRADHAAASSGGDLWAALKPSERLLLDEGHCLREQALAACADVAPERRATTSLETLRYMVAAGEGCTLMPRLATTPVDGVVYRDLPGQFARTIVLAWRKSDPREAEFRALVETLRSSQAIRL